MAKKKHKGLGKVALIGGIGLLAYYGYKKGWFTSIQEWISGLGDGSSSSTDTSTTDTTTTDTTADGTGTSWWESLINGISDLFGGSSDASGGGTGLSDLLTDASDWLKDQKDQKQQSALVEGGIGALGTVASALTTGTGAAAGASVASGALTPAAEAGAASPAAVQGTTSSGAAQAASTFWQMSGTPSQLSKLAASSPATIIQAVAEAAVPIVIGASPAVAEGVHQANVSITKWLQDIGVQKKTTYIQSGQAAATHAAAYTIAHESATDKVAREAIVRLQVKYGTTNLNNAGITQATAASLVTKKTKTADLYKTLETQYLATKK